MSIYEIAAFLIMVIIVCCTSWFCVSKFFQWAEKSNSKFFNMYLESKEIERKALSHHMHSQRLCQEDIQRLIYKEVNETERDQE